MKRVFTMLVIGGLLAACGHGAGEGPELRVLVPPGATFGDVADSLSARGIIGFKPGFLVVARMTKSDRRIEAGTYGFRRDESWRRILSDLREGRVLTAKVVIPEGFSIVKIVPRIASITGLDSANVVRRLSDPNAPKRFGVPGPTLEGYLYPATYIFDVHAPIDTVLAHMVRAYHRVWNARRQARADSIQMSEREVITLASIVEKEAKLRDELPVIASVYHNRLKIGYRLEADPTVQYALGAHREKLMYSDIEKVEKNPYNTYEISGLPPGPIGSPSDKAIDATLYPATTDFLYFVARPDGTHIFTKSLAEHNQAKQKARVLRKQTEAAQTTTTN